MRSSPFAGSATMSIATTVTGTPFVSKVTSLILQSPLGGSGNLTESALAQALLLSLRMDRCLGDALAEIIAGGDGGIVGVAGRSR